MLRLNMITLTQLSRLFAAGMVERGRGYLLQMGSLFSFQAGVGYASYAATKAFVLSFGEALNFELRGTGVSCTVLAPGVTATEFFDVSGQRPGWYHRLAGMTSADVARIGIRAMLKRRACKIAGWHNWMTIFGSRFAPRALIIWLVYKLMKTD